MRKTTTLTNDSILDSGLSQSSFIYPESSAVLATSSVTRPADFSTTLISSYTYDGMVELSLGAFDVDTNLRMLEIAAMNQGVPLERVVDSFHKYQRKIFRNADLLADVVAAYTGSKSRNVNPKNVTRLPGSIILKHVKQIVPSGSTEIDLITADFLAYCFSPFGWVMAEHPVTERFPRQEVHPTYQVLCDAVALERARVILEGMRQTSLKLLSDAINQNAGKNEPTGINATTIATTLNNAVTQSLDSVRSNRTASDVVDAVLAVISKRLDPVLPERYLPADYVLNDPVITKWSQNFGIFLISQRITKRPATVFSDTDLVKSVFPQFDNALSKSPAFKVESLGNTTGHLQLRHSLDYTDRAIYTVLAESWKSNNDLSVFEPVFADQTGSLRYLFNDDGLSQRMSEALNSTMSLFDINKAVTQRISAFDAMDPKVKSSASVGVVSTILPSVTSSLVDKGLTLDTALTLTKMGLRPTSEAILLVQEDCPKKSLRWAEETINNARDAAYASVMHFCLTHAKSADIVRVSSDERKNDFSDNTHGRLAIRFTHEARCRVPVGPSALLDGIIKTIEPVELLAYISDMEAAITLQPHTIDISKFEKSTHAWGWHAASTQLNRVSHNYAAFLGTSSYSVKVEPRNILGAGSLNGKLRFLRPVMAMVIADLWMDIFDDTKKYLESQSDKTAGVDAKVLASVLEARQLAHSLTLVNTLASVAKTTLGQNTCSYIYNSLAEQLFGAGRIDDVSKLYRGTERQRLETWAGLAILMHLDLVSQKQIDEITKFISDNNAIAVAASLKESAE